MKAARILLALAILLFGVALFFFLQSQNKASETDALRDLMTPIYEAESSYEVYEPEPEPEYDPTDINQTPPGVEPFVGSSACSFSWGLQMRQYCEDGDAAIIDKIDEVTQEEAMADLTMCLNDYIQQKDAYGKRDMRPMDSEIPLTEMSRKAFACDLTARYGDSPVFDKTGIHSITKEHLESGNIKRLENR